VSDFIVIIIVFSRIRPLGLFWFRIYFSETYVSIGQLVGLFGRGNGPTQGLYPHTHTKKTRIQIHASSGIEPTIPVFERLKTVRASDSSAIDWDRLTSDFNYSNYTFLFFGIFKPTNYVQSLRITDSYLTVLN